MKKIVLKQEEVSQYYCDITKKALLEESEIPINKEELLGCELVINQGYDGFIDGNISPLHFSAKVTAEIFQFLKEKYPETEVGMLFDDWELQDFL